MVMAGRSKEEGVRLLERSMQKKRLLEEASAQAKNDVLMNEWGENLDELQVLVLWFFCTSSASQGVLLDADVVCVLVQFVMRSCGYAPASSEQVPAF